MILRNQQMTVTVNDADGGLESLIYPDDPFAMNWVAGKERWGTAPGFDLAAAPEMDGIGVIRSSYQRGDLELRVSRTLTDSGACRERYELCNRGKFDIFLRETGFGVRATFNDNYDDAGLCRRERCHAHIWCGGEVAWVNALRMGIEGDSLGLALTRGTLRSYSVERETNSNDRGDFTLHPAPVNLMPGECFVLEWELFRHHGTDFHARLMEYPGMLYSDARHFTLFPGETPELTVAGGETPELPPVGRAFGPLTVPLDNGRRRTEARFWISPPVDELIRSRIRFIVANQQHNKPGSALDGAYLIYDNRESCRAFEMEDRDHNASRERLGMGLLIARYLQTTDDPETAASFDRYEAFVRREFFDEESGTVYDTIGRDPTWLRLYNAPWMSAFCLELYRLRRDPRYLEFLMRILRYYYANGGEKFYPNGLCMAESVCALREAGLERDAAEALEFCRRHVGRILANGTDYPPHEVRFEQTIVTPAATFCCDLFALTGEEIYRDAARTHMALLDRFHGDQPDYRLNGIPIRHWDGYWFGKSEMWGDTFPHYWSCLSARCFHKFAAITGDASYAEKARNTMRNTLNLFRPDGRASCAYLYPRTVNGRDGEFYDEWANDQDFALYFIRQLDLEL